MSLRGVDEGRGRARGSRSGRIADDLAPLLALVAVLALNAAPAWAGRRALIEIGLPPEPPTALDSIPHPWPGRALLLTAAGTALPIALTTGPHQHGENRAILLGAAELFTPAAGHLYAGLPRRALKGIAARAAGFALVGSGIAGMDNSEFDWGDVRVLAGFTVMAIAAAVDVITVQPDVERANRERVRARAAIGLRMTRDRSTPVLAVTARF